MAALLLNFSCFILICFFVSLFNLVPGIEISIVWSFNITSFVPLYPLSHIASLIVVVPTFFVAFNKTVDNVLESWILVWWAWTPTIIPDFLVVTIDAFVPNS